MQHISSILKFNEKPVRFGQRLQDLKESVDLKLKETHEVRKILMQAVCPDVERILNY